MMRADGFALFDTAIGPCGIAWGERGVVGVQLPESNRVATRKRLARRFPGAPEASPPRDVRRALGAITALLEGEAADLSAIALDMDGVPDFHRRVYEAARAIPPGVTLTYGEIAKGMGAPGSARAVGQALGRNPFAVIVPCHRVLAAGGRTGGFSASGGVSTKLRMLAIERRPSETPLFAGDGGLGFDPDDAVAHLRKVDPALGRLMDAAGPFRLQLKRTPSIFGALAEAIVYQQLAGKAAATIHGRVCALFPRAQDGPTPRNIQRATDATLRGAGLSRPKILALRDLATRALAGEIPTLEEAHGMDDAALIERLTAVRGIGRWTVEMLLIFRLGRPDVLPVDDYGIRKGVGVLGRRSALPDRNAVARRGARWAPYRSVASWYLWQAANGLEPRVSKARAKG
jgi:methylated-DNA-[protein]-cysteine S-methyltransferase